MTPICSMWESHKPKKGLFPCSRPGVRKLALGGYTCEEHDPLGGDGRAWLYSCQDSIDDPEYRVAMATVGSDYARAVGGLYSERSTGAEEPPASSCSSKDSLDRELPLPREPLADEIEVEPDWDRPRPPRRKEWWGEGPRPVCVVCKKRGADGIWHSETRCEPRCGPCVPWPGDGERGVQWVNR